MRGALGYFLIKLQRQEAEAGGRGRRQEAGGRGTRQRQEAEAGGRGRRQKFIEKV